MAACKLTKNQQAIEERVLASLSPLQLMKLEPHTAALIYAIQRGDLPFPDPEKLALWEDLQENGGLQRCDSAASIQTESSVADSPVTDITPKAAIKLPEGPRTAFHDACELAKTVKKTAKTRKKKKLSKAEESAPVSTDTAVKPKKQIAVTTVVKKGVSNPNLNSETVKLAKSTSSAKLKAVCDLPQQKFATPTNNEAALTSKETVVQVEKIEFAKAQLLTRSASKETLHRVFEENSTKNKTSRPRSCSPQENNRSNSRSGDNEVINSPPPRRSKRSLTIDTNRINEFKDSDVSSPIVRRSKLAEETDGKPSEQTSKSQAVAEKGDKNRKGSLRSSRKKSPVAVTQSTEDNFNANATRVISAGEVNEIEADNINVSGSEDFVDAEDDDILEIAAESEQEEEPEQEEIPNPKSMTRLNSVDVEEKPAKQELKPARTKPVSKDKARAEAQSAGPEADQAKKTATRTRVKNKANRPESRQAGPEGDSAQILIPSANDLVEKEKAMKNYTKPAEPKAMTKASSVVKSNYGQKHTYGNAPPSAQKPTYGVPRIGTPMKGTAKKPGPPTASKFHGMTPQQKAHGSMAMLGSGGGKPKMQNTVTKQTARPASPVASSYNKMPIAGGLAGAVALGKIPSVEENPPISKPSNLVSNVMSFVPQSHGIHGGATKGKTKLGTSTSASTLQKAAASSAATTMGLKAKAEHTAKHAVPAPTTNKLPKTGPSYSKLPVPVSGPPSAQKPVPAAHVMCQAFTNNKQTVTKAPHPGQPPPLPPQHPHHVAFDNENGPSSAFNATYSKNLDSTMAAFDITHFDETYCDYPIDDIKPCGDDDDDDEDDLKPIPDWAKPERLNARIEKQAKLDSRIRKHLDMDEEKVTIEGIEEALTNPDRPNRMRPRTSSQHWTTPPLLKSKQKSAANH